MSEQSLTLRRREWNETITVVRFPDDDYEALLPSRLDLVVKDSQIAECEREINRCQNQPPPPEVSQAKERLARGEYEPKEGDNQTTLDRKKTEKAEAEQKVEGFRQRREVETESWQTVMWRTQDSLERLEALLKGQIVVRVVGDNAETLPLDQEGAETVEYVFRMRRFTYAEKIQADENNTRIDLQDPNQRMKFDKPKRNLELLGVAIRGIVKATADEDGLAIPFEKQEISPISVLGIRSVSDLDDNWAEMLIERMWAKMNMDPQLVGYFRGSRRRGGRQPGRSAGDPA